MLTEHQVRLYLYNVASVIGVVVLEMLQNFEFYARLMLELLLVSDYLDGYDFTI